MPANIYNPIPVPIGDGIGAPVSIVGQGLKTFVIGGIFDATIIIEAGINGNFAPLYEIDKANQFRDVPVVAEDIRVRVVNHRSGQAIVIIGGEPLKNIFSAIPVPAGNGVGAPLDTAIWGAQKTLIVGGDFEATLTYEVSEDFNGPYSPLGSENGPTAASLDKSGNILNVKIINRFIRVRVTNYKSGTPFVGIGAAELAGDQKAQGPQSTLVYQQGGIGAGPVVFSLWNDLMAQLENMRSAAGGYFPVEIQFDDSIISPITIPADIASYDLTDTTLLGRSELGAAGLVTRVDFEDGATFIGLRKLGRNIGIVNLNTVSPADSSILGPTSIQIGPNSFINNRNGNLVPVWDTSGAAPGDLFLVTLEESGAFNYEFGGFVNGPIFDLSVPGTTLVLQVFDDSLVPSHGITGVLGTNLIINAPSMRAIPNAFSGFLGNVNFPLSAEIPPSLAPNPSYAAPHVAPIAAPRPGSWNRFDASAGPIAQPLVAISGFAGDYKQSGVMYAFGEESGTEGLTLVPQAGDTINGSADPFNVPGGGSVVLVDDGISNATILAISSPAPKHLFILSAPSPAPQTVGDHVGANVVANGDGNIEFYVPPDFHKIVSAHVLIIASQSHAAADIDLDTDYAFPGEVYNTNSESDNTITYPITLNQITELDVSSVLTGILAGHTVGLLLTNNAVAGGYLILGFHLSYL